MNGFQIALPREQPDYTRVRWFDNSTLREIYRVVPGRNSYDRGDDPGDLEEHDVRRWFEYGAGASAWWTWGEIIAQAWASGVDRLNIDRSGAQRSST